MFRFSLTQLLMGVALVAILLVFVQSDGCGRRFCMIECLSFSADGSQLLVSRLDARDARTPYKFYKADVSRTLGILATSDGNLTSVLRQDVRPGNRGTARDVWRIGRTSALFSADGRAVTNEFGEPGLAWYNVASDGKPIVAPLAHPALNIAVSQSGRLVAASGHCQLTVCDSASGNAMLYVSESNEAPFGHAALLGFTADETRVIVGGDMGVQLWDIASRSRSQNILQGLDSAVEAMAILPDDTLIVCSDNWTRRYDLSGKLLATLAFSGGWPVTCASSGASLAAVSFKGQVTIHEIPTGRIRQPVLRRGGAALALSHDGSMLAVSATGGKVELFDVRSGNRRWAMQAPGRYRSPWTVPMVFLAIWGLIAWRLLARRQRQATVVRPTILSQTVN